MTKGNREVSRIYQWELYYTPSIHVPTQESCVYMRRTVVYSNRYITLRKTQITRTHFETHAHRIMLISSYPLAHCARLFICVKSHQYSRRRTSVQCIDVVIDSERAAEDGTCTGGHVARENHYAIGIPFANIVSSLLSR